MMPAVSRAVRRNEGWRNQPRWESGREEGGRWKGNSVSYEEDSAEWLQSIEQDTPLTQAEKDALKRYANDFMINDSLRAVKGDTYALKEDDLQQMRHLDSAIAKGATTAPITVYRGVSNDAFSEYSWQTAEDLVGLSWSNDAYMSTSGSKSEAEMFAGGYGDSYGGETRILIEIKVPAGTNGLYVETALGAGYMEPGWPNDLGAEFLIGRGRYLKVKSAVQDEWGDIQMEATLE